MKHAELWSQIEETIARHDLLQHPFYQAWTAGTLGREDLRHYAAEYYHQVAAFPTYLSALHSRLPDGELRRAVLRNLSEEEIGGRPHSELWLDFAAGMDADREVVRSATPSGSTRALIEAFREIAATAPPLAALGAFYAYESQVARIAGLKAQGLREKYAADDRTCAYFTLHSAWDVHHSRVWAEKIDEGLSASDAPRSELLAAVERAAAAMWSSLDGVYRACAPSCN
jgi:pyrroloquinoline-quinone synthase